MGFFSRIFGRERADTMDKTLVPSSIDAFFGLGNFRDNAATTQFKDYTVLERLEIKAKLATVFGCVSAISLAFSDAPITVMRKDEEGEDEPMPNHPVLDVFNKNPWLSAEEMQRYIIEHLELAGAAYIWKWKDGFGIPREIWPLPPNWVKPHPLNEPLRPGDPRRIIDWYDVYPPGSPPMRIAPQDIIYIRDLRPSSLWLALSGTEASSHGSQSQLQADEYFMQAYASLKAPGLIIKTERPLTTDQQQMLHRALEEKLGSSGRRNALLVSGSGTSVEMLNPLGSMDWNMIRDYDEIRICQAYNVPPIVAGCWVGAKNSPWSNTEDAWRAFYQHKMAGRWKHVAQGLTKGLLLPDTNQRFVYDTTEVKYLQEEQDKLITRATALLENGLIDRNRALVMIGEQPLPDGDPRGTESFMPIGLQPFQLTGPIPEPVAPPTPEEAAAEHFPAEEAGAGGKEEATGENPFGRKAVQDQETSIILEGMADQETLVEVERAKED